MSDNWHKLEFVDISEEEEYYKYIYVVLSKSTFTKKYLKIEFQSTVPHYRWTDIPETMEKADVYFEDIVNGELLDIGIGHITYTEFTASEFEKYGNNIARWIEFRKDALASQEKLCDEYREVWGDPDLPEAILWR